MTSLQFCCRKCYSTHGINSIHSIAFPQKNHEKALIPKRLSSFTSLFIYKSPSHDSGLPDTRGAGIGGDNR